MQGNEEVQSKYNPVEVYEAFVLPDGEVNGSKISHITYIECLRRFDVSHKFAGKTITIWIVSHDRRIDYFIALHLATAIALGKVKHRSIDLSPINDFTPIKKRGK